MPVVAVAGVLVLALVVAGVVVLLDRSDDATEPDDERAADAELVVAPRDLVFALQDERAMATVTLLGMAETVRLPVGDNAEARARTDAAVADFEARAAQASEAGAPAYRDALDALPGLGTLRGEIDGRTQPPGLSEAPYAGQIYDRYSETIAALLDANTRFVSGIDDPERRRGAELFETALRQIELVSQLGNELTADPGSWSTSEWVTAVAALRAGLEEGRVTVTELADGAYADAADQLGSDLEAAGSLDAVDEALSTGQGDIPRLITSMGSLSQAWRSFLDSVESILTRQS